MFCLKTTAGECLNGPSAWDLRHKSAENLNGMTFTHAFTQYNGSLALVRCIYLFGISTAMNQNDFISFFLLCKLSTDHENPQTTSHTILPMGDHFISFYVLSLFYTI